jgi:hypothetical protein
MPIANSAVVAYSDPMRGKQQGLGTKLSHAKNRRDSLTVRGPHNITLICGVLTIVTPTPENAPSLNPAPQRTLYANCSDKAKHEETPGFQNLFCDLPSAVFLGPGVCRDAAPAGEYMEV